MFQLFHLTQYCWRREGSLGRVFPPPLPQGRDLFWPVPLHRPPTQLQANLAGGFSASAFYALRCLVDVGPTFCRSRFFLLAVHMRGQESHFFFAAQLYVRERSVTLSVMQHSEGRLANSRSMRLLSWVGWEPAVPSAAGEVLGGSHVQRVLMARHPTMI